MTTTSETPTRRVRVRFEPVAAALGIKPWRAVILEQPAPNLERTEIPVGRFDDQPTAVTAACSALRFLAAGIPWRVTE